MLTRTFDLLLVTLCLGVLGEQAGLADDTSTPRDESTRVTNAILQEGDLPGLKLQKVHLRQWVNSLDPKGRPLGVVGVEQECSISGVRALIHYAQFDSNETAHHAAVYLTRDVAAVFEKGLWAGADQKSLGDESWFSRDAGNVALLVRSARVCVLVRCREGDAAKQTHAAEALAKRIADKVSSGGKVIIPKDDSPKKKAPE